MTVANTTSRNQYTATAGQTAFPYTFEVIETSDLAALKNGAALSEGTDYTLTGVGNENGGTLTLVVAASAGDIITIYRDMELSRTTDYQENGDFLASEVNEDFDRLWLALQQVGDNNTRALRASESDTVLNETNTIIADIATRASKTLGFDADGRLAYNSIAIPQGDMKFYSNRTLMIADTTLEPNDIAVVTSPVISFYNISSSGATDGFVNLELDNGNKASLIANGVLNIKQAGAVMDGTTDDSAAVQAAFDSGILNIVVPEGTSIISVSVQPAENQTVTFYGEFKLKGGLNTASGNVPNSVLSVIRDNVTLVNPKIDGNRQNTVDDGGQSGVYSCIAAYGSTGNDNLRIRGGVLKNGIHNLLQGTSRNGLVDGTVMENSGEHNVYLNETDGMGGSVGSRFTFQNCVLKNPFLDPALHSEGHYFQCRNSKIVVIDNCTGSGAGSGGASAPTFAVLAENLDELIVKKSTFTDVTNSILFIDSGKATISNSSFDVLSGIATLSMMTATGAEEVTFDKCTTNAYYQNVNLGPDKLVLKDCDFTHVTTFAIDMDADIKGCTFNGSGTETWIDVSAGVSDIQGNTFKGSSFRLSTSGDGSAMIQGNKFPEVTTGSYHIQIASTTGWAQVMGNNLPLSTSTATIRVSGAVTTEVIVGGNYLPSGTILDLSTNAVLYGNVTV